MTSAVQLIFTSLAEASSNLHFQTPAAQRLGNVGTFISFQSSSGVKSPITFKLEKFLGQKDLFLINGKIHTELPNEIMSHTSVHF